MDATEQTFDWTYSEDGIVQVRDTRYREDPSNVTSPVILEHKLTALKEGTATVTGTPKDDTKGAKPVVFTVTVGKGDTVTFDYDKYVTQNIAHGNESIKKALEGNYVYGAEWYIFTALRSGGNLSTADLEDYYESVTDKLKNGSGRMQPTDYFLIAVTLEVMGKDPTDADGVNVIEKIYNFENLDKYSSNQIAFALLALDSKNYRIPENAKWSREDMIEALLSFQKLSGDDEGGFGLGGSETASVDITAMILQALAPYNDEEHPKVAAAVTKALKYLQKEQSADGGYWAEGYDNGCTAAQVLTALCALGIDPLDEDNGFVKAGKIFATMSIDEFKKAKK